MPDLPWTQAQLPGWGRPLGPEVQNSLFSTPRTSGRCPDSFCKCQCLVLTLKEIKGIGTQEVVQVVQATSGDISPEPQGISSVY